MKRYQVIFLAVIAIIITSCSSGPEHYGFFIREGRGLTEILETNQIPNVESFEHLQTFYDMEPEFILWQPIYDLNNLVFASLLTGEEMGFNAAPEEDNTLIITPKEGLRPGVYCMIQGDPLGAPGTIPYWCFRFGGWPIDEEYPEVSKFVHEFYMVALAGNIDWREENACAYYFKHVEVGKLLNKGIFDGFIEADFERIENSSINLLSIDIEEVSPGKYGVMYTGQTPSGPAEGGFGKVVKTESGYCMCFASWDECEPKKQ